MNIYATCVRFRRLALAQVRSQGLGGRWNPSSFLFFPHASGLDARLSMLLCLTTKSQAVESDYGVCGMKSVWDRWFESRTIDRLISVPRCIYPKYKSRIVPDSVGLLPPGIFCNVTNSKIHKNLGLIYIYIHHEFALKDIKLQCYSVKNLFWCGFFYYYVFYPGLLVFFLIFYYFF